MKNKGFGVFKRLTAGLLAAIMVVMLVPIVSAIDPDAISGRVSDPSTMDGWRDWFGSSVGSTKNAGGVWTDKSVFTDASAFPEGTVSLDGEDNFLVALSAIASNKTIVGYSNIPTDTMLVLDVSGSMEGNVDDLVAATNESIRKLYEVNNHNRVGVILYSGNSEFGTSNTGTATVLLPLDRYTAGNSKGDFLAYSSRYEGSGYNRELVETVSIARNVRGSDSTSDMSGSKDAVGGTYIQNGLYKAYEEFSKVENTTIEDGFQAGMQIMPIIVLMSDGAPTSATTSYANVGVSNAGNGANGGATENMAFLTQLTASYVHARVKEKYNREPLFYTLGLGVGDSDVAQSVLDPVGLTDDKWASYKRLSGDYSTLSLVLPNTSGNSNNISYSTKSIYRNSYCTLEDYVDEYYPASNSAQMIESFQKIVDEIIIQSRYYPTHLKGSDPDFGGYITFEDAIGEYMEVKEVKGILLGDTLFDGAMLASQINSSSNGLGTVDNPTELGNEFIRAIKARLGISSTEEAQTLAEYAWKYKQLYYESKDNFSNYIGWYAKADGSYHSFWHEGMTEHPADAAYINRSYGFLGKAEGNIKDSDMMYMSVQVHTNIKNGHQMVIWKIPAALVPVVTYKITLEGDSIEDATDIEMVIEDAEPIRLVFETGVRSDINELNVASVMAAADGKFKAEDGYYFWTNRWNDSGSSNFSDTATEVHFVPSEENERYYYVEDSDIYVLEDGDYVAVDYASSSDFDENTDYYRMRTEFSLSSVLSKNATKSQVPEKIASDAFDKKQQRDDGSWYIPRGTALHHFDDIVVNKESNPTQSLDYSANPYVMHVGSMHEAEVRLGNNGRLKVTPAQGIMLTKSLDAVEPGTDTEFGFVIELDAPAGVALAGEYPYVIAKTGEYEGREGMAKVVGNKIEMTVSAGETLFLTGLPTGVEYSVTESADNSDYKLKSVSVNGVHSNDGVAKGSVTAYLLDDVHFVNTPVTVGSLIVSKSVTHPFGSGYSIPEGLEFNVSIALKGDGVAGKSFPAYTSEGETKVTTDANGVFSVTLADGGSISVHEIPEGTEYTVTETNIPAGFTVSSASTGLNGVVSAEGNAVASLVNDYSPAPATPDIEVVVDKLLSGRDFAEGDSFEFVLERYSDSARAGYVVIDRATATAMSDIVDGKLVTTLSLDGESYTAAGSYHYAIVETDASLTGNGVPGVTYDKTRLHFTVVVADADMDGSLEASAVTPLTPVTVSGDVEDGFTVHGQFNNSYRATVPETVTVDITKLISNPSNATIGRNGFSFTLYDEAGEAVAHSNITDVNGKAIISMTFGADFIGESYTYTLKEDVHTSPIPGMTYSTEEKTFTVEIIDNNDGSVGTLINGVKADRYAAEFTNIYEPENAFLILSGNKNLSGRIVNENEFSFSLFETDEDYAYEGKDALYVAFAGYDRSFAFPMMTYDSVGKHYYVIVENEGSLGGVEYDGSIITVEVDVSDVDGQLVTAVTMLKDGVSIEAIEFNNVYTATPATVPIGGTKILSGRPLAEAEFEFELIGSDGNVIESVKNDGDGGFAFSSLELDKAGRYIYTVKETEGSLGGITYDNSIFTVTVDVTDNGMGALVYSVSYNKGGNDASEIVFSNSYSASPVEVKFDGIKNLEGRALNEGEFEFRLTNTGNGNTVETVYNKADGSFEFSPVTFRAADTYHYTVTEVNNDRGGIDYDATVYSVHVKVTDDGQGQLVAEAEYLLGDATVESLEFTNYYSTTPAMLILSGTKTLNGRDLVAGEFEFELYETDSDYVIGGEASAVVSNGENGVFEFPSMSYDTVGDRYYVIVEHDGGVKGITYDKTEYRVRVSVTDNNEGALVASVEATDSEGNSVEALSFVNAYTEQSVTVGIDVVKTVENRSEKQITAEGFDFLLTKNGATVTKVTSDENGRARLELSFNDSDAGKTYSYILKEINGGMAGVTYDTREYKLDITVDFDENGELVASVVKDGKTENATVAEFVNVYEVIEPGDDSMFVAWIALLIISGGAAITLGKNGKNKRREF